MFHDFESKFQKNILSIKELLPSFAAIIATNKSNVLDYSTDYYAVYQINLCHLVRIFDSLLNSYLIQTPDNVSSLNSSYITSDIA